MSVALLHGSHTLGAQHRTFLWWDDHAGSAVGTLLFHGLVHWLLIVGAIARKGGQFALELAQQRGNSFGITGVAGRKVCGHDGG